VEKLFGQGEKSVLMREKPSGSHGGETTRK